MRKIIVVLAGIAAATAFGLVGIHGCEFKGWEGGGGCGVGYDHHTRLW